MVNGLACYKAPVGISFPRRSDVVIIGGGFAGCATAWALAERGVAAVVLEREPELGRHASGRGAGLGRQLANDDPTTTLVVRGAALLRERFGHSWMPTGGILTFDDPGHAQAYIARARRFEIPHEVIDRADVAQRWPIGKLPIAAGLFVPSDGVIDTHSLLAAFAERADVRFGIEVVRVSDGLVETSHGVIATRVVVDASGAWAGTATADPPLETYKRHLFTLEAVGLPQAPYLWHLGEDELYVRGDGDALLACPCDVEASHASDQQPAPDAETRYRERFAKLPLGDAPIIRRWACQRAFTADRQMRLGPDPRRPWLVWAAALGGHGATAAAAVGERVANAVIEMV